MIAVPILSAPDTSLLLDARKIYHTKTEMYPLILWSANYAPVSKYKEFCDMSATVYHARRFTLEENGVNQGNGGEYFLYSIFQKEGFSKLSRVTLRRLIKDLFTFHLDTQCDMRALFAKCLIDKMEVNLSKIKEEERRIALNEIEAFTGPFHGSDVEQFALVNVEQNSHIAYQADKALTKSQKDLVYMCDNRVRAVNVFASECAANNNSMDVYTALNIIKESAYKRGISRLPHAELAGLFTRSMILFWKFLNGLHHKMYYFYTLDQANSIKRHEESEKNVVALKNRHTFRDVKEKCHEQMYQTVVTEKEALRLALKSLLSPANNTIRNNAAEMRKLYELAGVEMLGDVPDQSKW